MPWPHHVVKCSDFTIPMPFNLAAYRASQPPCECAVMDWMGHDMTQEHHPACPVLAALRKSLAQSLTELIAHGEATNAFDEAFDKIRAGSSPDRSVYIGTVETTPAQSQAWHEIRRILLGD